MVRAPCCEKMGLKKGPWTPEEDKILINYIQLHGHGNWRALPKQAGLLRCGKSCRLRWVNYLNPEIKRGNFTREEEETIIQLHDMLGNRWSAIAARLPGRTDNEIKNVWHTHLKKRLKNQNREQEINLKIPKMNQQSKTELLESTTTSSSDISSVTTSDDSTTSANMKLDESFWSEVLSGDKSSTSSEFAVIGNDSQIELQVSSLIDGNDGQNYFDNDMDFWQDLFDRAGELQEVSEFFLKNLV